MIKEGMGAYWKYTKSFGIVTRIKVTNCPRSGPHVYYVTWEDTRFSQDMGYGLADIAEYGELVIGDYKTLKVLYANS